MASLTDLFEEIDVNGDGYMEWDEFTGYCVELGFVATRRQLKPLKYKVRTRIQQHSFVVVVKQNILNPSFKHSTFMTRSLPIYGQRAPASIKSVTWRN